MSVELAKYAFGQYAAPTELQDRNRVFKKRRLPQLALDDALASEDYAYAETRKVLFDEPAGVAADTTITTMHERQDGVQFHGPIGGSRRAPSHNVAAEAALTGRSAGAGSSFRTPRRGGAATARSRAGPSMTARSGVTARTAGTNGASLAMRMASKRRVSPEGPGGAASSAASVASKSEPGPGARVAPGGGPDGAPGAKHDDGNLLEELGSPGDEAGAPGSGGAGSSKAAALVPGGGGGAAAALMAAMRGPDEDDGDVFKLALSAQEDYERVHGPNNDPGWCLRRTGIVWNAFVWYVQMGCFLASLGTFLLAEWYGWVLIGVLLWILDAAVTGRAVARLFRNVFGVIDFDDLTWGEYIALSRDTRMGFLSVLFLAAPAVVSKHAFRAPGERADDMRTAIFAYRMSLTAHAAAGALPMTIFSLYTLASHMADGITFGTRNKPKVLMFQIQIAAVTSACWLVCTALTRLRMNGPSGRATDDDAFTMFVRPRKHRPAWWRPLMYLESFVEIPTRLGVMTLFGIAWGGWVLVVALFEVLFKTAYVFVFRPMAEPGEPRSAESYSVDLVFWLPPSVVGLYTPVKQSPGYSFWRQYGLLFWVDSILQAGMAALPMFPQLRPANDPIGPMVTIVAGDGLCEEFTAAARCVNTIPQLWVYTAMGLVFASRCMFLLLLRMDWQFKVCACTALKKACAPKPPPPPPEITDEERAAAAALGAVIVVPGADG